MRIEGDCLPKETLGSIFVAPIELPQSQAVVEIAEQRGAGGAASDHIPAVLGKGSFLAGPHERLRPRRCESA